MIMFRYFFFIANMCALSFYTIQANNMPQPLYSHAYLNELCKKMATQAGIDTDTICVVYDPHCGNASVCYEPFGYVIAFNPDLADELSHDELVAVLGHELMHIKNEDCKPRNPIYTIGRILPGIWEFITNMVYFAQSRERELRADREAARHFRCAAGMISFLKKMRANQVAWNPRGTSFFAVVYDAMACTFFRTHPHDDDRINALETYL